MSDMGDARCPSCGEQAASMRIMPGSSEDRYMMDRLWPGGPVVPFNLAAPVARMWLSPSVLEVLPCGCASADWKVQARDGQVVSIEFKGGPEA